MATRWTHRLLCHIPAVRAAAINSQLETEGYGPDFFSREAILAALPDVTPATHIYADTQATDALKALLEGVANVSIVDQIPIRTPNRVEAALGREGHKFRKF